MPLAERRCERTKTSYGSAMAAFEKVAGSKSTYSEEDIRRAVLKLEKRYSPGYVKYILSVCKAVLGDRWPSELRGRKIYSVPRSSIKKVVLPEGAIEQMIRTSKRPGYNPTVRGYLVVSTLFGARCVELSRIGKSDIKENSIYLQTAKGGIDRAMYIPPSVRWYLGVAQFLPMSVARMGGLFKLAANWAGVEVPFGAGWHAIRRSLVTRFVQNDINKASVKVFMRWKDQDTMDGYIVDQGFKIDKKVFENHPYLKVWEEKS